MSQEQQSQESQESQDQTTQSSSESDDKGLLDGIKEESSEEKGLLDDAGKEETEGAKEKEEPKDITYEDFKLPENTEVNQAQLDSFTDLAKKHGLTQEAAQELIDLYGSQLNAQMNEKTQELVELRKEWKKTINQDPEIGGNNIKKSLGLVISALNKFPGGDEVKAMLIETGLQDNPSVIKFLYHIGKATSEDSVDDFKGGKAGEKKSAEEILYPGYG